MSHPAPAPPVVYTVDREMEYDRTVPSGAMNSANDRLCASFTRWNGRYERIKSPTVASPTLFQPPNCFTPSILHHLAQARPDPDPELTADTAVYCYNSGRTDTGAGAIARQSFDRRWSAALRLRAKLWRDWSGGWWRGVGMGMYYWASDDATTAACHCATVPILGVYSVHSARIFTGTTSPHYPMTPRRTMPIYGHDWTGLAGCLQTIPAFLPLRASRFNGRVTDVGMHG
ncbi:hypothetical protein EDC01DRAFT_724812 [Geopyxis carbonaria]|nr:hypothetical protein EDC01DRAFT_724812 [Geopyxis carbonaria]